jgi:S1-C subfamily serine protease
VKVLSIVEGSPAARAGFQGANTPASEQSSLLKAAIVVLAMSPAGPFAIPLAIAHDMYTNRHAPGDLIVAIDDQPVRNAQEFSEVMRRYQPGDTVSFSIIRAGKPMQLSVQLEEEPL